MKKYSLIFLLIPIFLAITNAGCSTTQASFPGAQLQSWIDAPLDQSILPLAPYEIVTHGTDPQEIKSIEIRINDKIISTPSNPKSSQLLMTASFLWLPAEPGDYQIQARSLNGSGTWSDPASVTVRVARETPTAQPTRTMTPTSTPEVTATICFPGVEVIQNATCRLGPSTFHLPSIYFIEGESLPIVGGNLDQTWWAVQAPELDQPCWISGQIVSTFCLPEEIEYLESPPYIGRVTTSNSEFYWADHPLKEITIQAQIGGESEISSARVAYRLKGKNQWYNIPLLKLSGDVWTGKINARSFDGYKDVSSAIVEYYLEATAVNGLWTQSPILDDIKLKKGP